MTETPYNPYDDIDWLRAEIERMQAVRCPGCAELGDVLAASTNAITKAVLWKLEVDRLTTEVERLTKELTEYRERCNHCGCAVYVLMTEWQDISTAPKGRAILACRAGITLPEIVEWRAERPEYVDEGGNLWLACPAGWFLAPLGPRSQHKLTHWMPLSKTPDRIINEK